MLSKAFRHQILLEHFHYYLHGLQYSFVAFYMHEMYETNIFNFLLNSWGLYFFLKSILISCNRRSFAITFENVCSLYFQNHNYILGSRPSSVCHFVQFLLCLNNGNDAAKSYFSISVFILDLRVALTLFIIGRRCTWLTGIPIRIPIRSTKFCY